MDGKKIAIHTLNILAIMLYIALFGVTVWPITGLYGSSPDWWGGNSAIHATKYAGFAAVAGAVALAIHLEILRRRRKISRKSTRLVQVVGLCCAVALSSACLPYFIIPAQVGSAARAEFAKTWGVDWESRVHRPAQGPWMDSPYFLFQQYYSLPYSQDAFTFHQDIEFLHLGNDSFKCDVFLPAGTGPNPVMIFIHGGGWVGGDKNSIIAYQLQYFAAAGYTVFSVQYGAMQEANRTRQYSMPEILSNLGAFSDWLAQPGQVIAYHLNLSCCFLNGLSAGGHLSALLGMARTKLAAWNPAVHVVGAIDFYGITDIRHWDVINQQWLVTEGLFNNSILANYSIVDRYSPMTYAESPGLAGSDIVPLLIFHGDVDNVVSVTQSRDMNAMCDSRGLKCVYIEIPRATHVFEGESNAGPSQVTLWAMERFMQLCAE